MLENSYLAEKEFEMCWNNPLYTQITLHDVDVNHTLLQHYKMSRPISFTREMLWDMEIKKAWNPGKYIPYVVRQGTAHAWGKRLTPDGWIFARESEQKQWLHPDTYEKVYEEVYVNNDKQVVTFLGVTTLPERDVPLTPRQSLFHVQHGVAGEEHTPLNTWRIVHLTEDKSEHLLAQFKRLNASMLLPGFLEVYIQEDLGVELERI